MTKLRRFRYFINGDQCIKENFNRGIINVRALAAYIIKEEHIDASLDAVISAIRRYRPEDSEETYDNARKMIRKTTAISTKSPLANISLIKDSEIQEILPKLFSIIHYRQGDVLRIIQADESLKVVVDEKNLAKVKALFPEKKILKVDENLGEINVHMHPDSRYITGILALALDELAVNGINILDAMSSHLEWVWFVDEKDLQKAFNILTRILRAKERDRSQHKQSIASTLPLRQKLSNKVHHENQH